MILYPDLGMKKSIIANAVETFGKIDYENPIIVTSCGASAEEKFDSIALCAVTS